jgi:hypothetical protein
MKITPSQSGFVVIRKRNWKLPTKQFANSSNGITKTNSYEKATD